MTTNNPCDQLTSVHIPLLSHFKQKPLPYIFKDQQSIIALNIPSFFQCIQIYNSLSAQSSQQKYLFSYQPIISSNV